MPSGIGGSYRSLAEDVYKTTTMSEEKFSVMESVKKAFNLIGNTRTQGPYIVTDEEDKKTVAAVRYVLRFFFFLLHFSASLLQVFLLLFCLGN